MEDDNPARPHSCFSDAEFVALTTLLAVRSTKVTADAIALDEANVFITVDPHRSPGGRLVTGPKYGSVLRALAGDRTPLQVLTVHGDTGGGKSFLLRALSADANPPLPSHNVLQSCTRGLRAYHGVRKAGQPALLLWDTEGFRGIAAAGVVAGAGDDHAAGAASRVAAPMLMDGEFVHVSVPPSTSAGVAETADALRQRMVDEVLPRLSYMFSDVMVYVTRHPPKQLQALMEPLEWGAAASSGALQALKPRLVVVFNCQRVPDELAGMDPLSAGTAWRSAVGGPPEDPLAALRLSLYYRDVAVVFVPELRADGPGGAREFIDAQAALHAVVHMSLAEGYETRQLVGQQLQAGTLQRLVPLALTLMEQHPDRAIKVQDLVWAASPPPRDWAESMVTVFRRSVAAARAYAADARAQAWTDALESAAAAIAGSYVMLHVRSQSRAGGAGHSPPPAIVGEAMAELAADEKLRVVVEQVAVAAQALLPCGHVWSQSLPLVKHYHCQLGREGHGGSHKGVWVSRSNGSWKPAAERLTEFKRTLRTANWYKAPSVEPGLLGGVLAAGGFVAFALGGLAAGGTLLAAGMVLWAISSTGHTSGPYTARPELPVRVLDVLTQRVSAKLVQLMTHMRGAGAGDAVAVQWDSERAAVVARQWLTQLGPEAGTDRCASCLVPGAAQRLHTCGHMLCEACLTEGVWACALCSAPHNLSDPLASHPGLGVRMLTLDGGGVKGMTQLVVLEEMERRLYGAPIAEAFDHVTGTSAGGIIALGLVAAGPRRLSVREMRDAYSVVASATFGDGSGGVWSAMSRAWGWIRAAVLKGALHSREGLHEAVTELLGTHELRSVRGWPRVAVTSVTQLLRGSGLQAVLFTNYLRPAPDRAHRPVTVLDTEVALASVSDAAEGTSAAAAYLPGFKLVPGVTLGDGGMLHNNPALLALQEVRALWGVDRRVDVLVSLGTGRNPTAPGAAESAPLGSVTSIAVRAATETAFNNTLTSVVLDHALQQLTEVEHAWTAVQLAEKDVDHTRLFRVDPVLSRCVTLDAVNDVPAVVDSATAYLTSAGGSAYVARMCDRVLASCFAVIPASADDGGAAEASAGGAGSVEGAGAHPLAAPSRGAGSSGGVGKSQRWTVVWRGLSVPLALADALRDGAPAFHVAMVDGDGVEMANSDGWIAEVDSAHWTANLALAEPSTALLHICVRNEGPGSGAAGVGRVQAAYLRVLLLLGARLRGPTPASSTLTGHGAVEGAAVETTDPVPAAEPEYLPTWRAPSEALQIAGSPVEVTWV